MRCRRLAVSRPKFATLPSAAALLFTIVIAAVAKPLAGQGTTQCVLEFEGVNTRSAMIQLPSERFNVFQGGGVTYHCQGQGNTLKADSAEYYGDLSVLFLIGNVHYTETRAKVDSDRMTYFQIEDRLPRRGQRQRSAPNRIDHERACDGLLPHYPHAPDDAHDRHRASDDESRSAFDRRGTPAPVYVVANTIVAEGDNLVYASGKVEITRPDVVAKAIRRFSTGSASLRA